MPRVDKPKLRAQSVGERAGLKAAGPLQTAKTPARRVRDGAPVRVAEKAKVALETPSQVQAVKQTNHGQNVSWTPRFAFRPGREIESLVAAMEWISKNLDASVKVKAGGSKHSWSPAAATSGAYLHPEGIKFFAAPSALRADVPKARAANLFEIGSGTTIREVNKELWGRGKAIPVLGGFDGQTLGGVLPTGTHGSVLKAGTLADTLVRQVNLVTADGSKLRIEPRGGLTDPQAFAQSHPGWRLIQDDTYFAAAKVNMGTLGVVHSYVIEATDRFWLEEKRTQTTFSEMKNVLSGGGIYELMEHDGASPGQPRQGFAGHPARAHHLEFLWNPHSEKVVVTSRQPLRGEAEQKLQTSEPREMASSPARDLLRALSSPKAHVRPALGTWLAEHVGGVVSDVGELLQKLRPETAVELVDLSLDAMKDGRYVGRSYNVYNIGDGANLLPAQSGTISVPLEGDAYLKALDIMKRTAAELAAKGKYQDGPISVRFKKGSGPPEGSLLADRKDAAQFEVILSGNDAASQKRAKRVMAAYYEALHRELGDDVKLHFGQLYPEEAMTPARTRAAHPGLDAFNRVRKELDPQGRFTNEFQEKVLGR